MELFGIYKYSNGTITKQDDFMCSMFSTFCEWRTDMNDLFDHPSIQLVEDGMTPQQVMMRLNNLTRQGVRWKCLSIKQYNLLTKQVVSQMMF